MHGGAIWRAQVHVEQVQVQSGGGRPAAAPVIHEKPRNCSCGARSSAVSSCQSSAPRCRTGPNPGHVRPFFYVTGPAEPIYLHKSSSNATRVDPFFTTVTSMHDAWQYGDGGLYLAGGSQTIAALSRNLRLSVSSPASPL